jgi:hypothetical protein
VTETNWNLSEPYVYQALSSAVGMPISVQTERGSVRGNLLNVQPDHIVVEMGGNQFFIMTRHIIWAVPNPTLKME